jgi:hypothetical protein
MTFYDVTSSIESYLNELLQSFCDEIGVGSRRIWRRIQRHFRHTIQFCGITKLGCPNSLEFFGLQSLGGLWQAGGMASDAKSKKNPAAVALGRLGGLKGGPARTASMTPAQRKAAARKAALARWSKKQRKPEILLIMLERSGILIP